MLAAFLIAARLPAQSGDAAPGSIFAPFVTRLNADISGKVVRLKWQDSHSARGPVYVYRSRTPFAGQGAQYQARSLEVPFGQETFVEEVEALGMWYYFVVASDESRMRYEMVIPYNNIIDVQLDGGSRFVPASPGMLEPSGPLYSNQGIISQPAQRAVDDPTWNSAFGSYGVARNEGGPAPYTTDIVDINVQPLPNGIYISFRSSEFNKNAQLYRSNRPIASVNDLLTAAVVKDRLSSPFIDYPPPGVAYYYAVLYEEDVQSGRAGIYPGSNATVNPVQLGGIDAAASGYAGPPAFSPAPPSAQQSTYLAPDSGYFSTVKTPTPLSSRAAEAVEEMRNKPEVAPVIPKSSYGINMEPRVFNQDVQSNAASGEDYELAMIVRGSFFRKDWGVARGELQKYLATTRSPAAAARARFYLGQCGYFLGDVKTALNDFMAVHPLYPEEAAGWVQASLAKIGGRQ